MHVDRNWVQAKQSSTARVFSTPVRFGVTSHQTRSVTERSNAGDVDSNSVLATQKDVAVSAGGHSYSQRNQQTAEKEPEVTWDSHPTPRISERKSVFERLFEKAQHQRHSKREQNTSAAATIAPTDSRQRQADEAQKKLSSKRPNMPFFISGRQRPVN